MARNLPIPISSSTPASKATRGARSNFFEGDKVDAPALKKLVRAAIEYNQSKLKKNAKKASAKKPARLR